MLKKLSSILKDKKLKIQISIQGDQLRVSGKREMIYKLLYLI